MKKQHDQVEPVGNDLKQIGVELPNVCANYEEKRYVIMRLREVTRLTESGAIEIGKKRVELLRER